MNRRGWAAGGSWVSDSLAIAAATAFLIWPLFRLKYADAWASIESTFIADSRMLAARLPHPGWQPLWYCGTRWDYVYPPALRYGTAWLAVLGHMTTARAYHLYTALFYVFGIAAVYWLVRAGTESRVTAWLVAAATALLSPSFLLLPAIRRDSMGWIPQRLHVLAAYGEGPHISALTVLPAALAVSLLALRGGHARALAGAAILCALVVSTNFYGATALAIFFPVLVWAVWLGVGGWRVWARAAAIAALACGLCAFWLTPSYLRITLLDLKWVAQPGNPRSRLEAIGVAGLFCLVSWYAARGRRDRVWSVFVWGAALLVSLDVLGLAWFGFRVTGDSWRLVPELDLVLILAGAEVVRAMWRRPLWRIVAGVAVVAAFGFAANYLRHPWSPFARSGPIENQYPYKIAAWVRDRLPGERVFTSGTARLWFDAWADNSEPVGGSAQGLSNQNLPDANYQVTAGADADLAIAWLRALGTDAVVVPGKASLEVYRDFQHPEKFAGVLPVLFDDTHGTAIYRVPRLYPNIARVVGRRAMAALAPIHGGADAEPLRRYVEAIEDPSQREITVTWRGFDGVDLDADLDVNAGTDGDDAAILLQETYDPAWRAYEGARELSVRIEPVMGFMLIDVPAGRHSIRMRFETPAENRVGAAVSALAVALAIAMLLVRPAALRAGPGASAASGALAPAPGSLPD